MLSARAWRGRMSCVRFRDGRWQDYTVTIGVTENCTAGGISSGDAYVLA